MFQTLKDLLWPPRESVANDTLTYATPRVPRPLSPLSTGILEPALESLGRAVAKDEASRTRSL